MTKVNYKDIEAVCVPSLTSLTYLDILIEKANADIKNGEVCEVCGCRH